MGLAVLGGRYLLLRLVFSLDSSLWAVCRSELFTACRRSCSFPMLLQPAGLPNAAASQRHGDGSAQVGLRPLSNGRFLADVTSCKAEKNGEADQLSGTRSSSLVARS